MKRLFGIKGFAYYAARGTKTFIWAALAILLVGCGGGGDDFAVTCGGHSCINNDTNDEPGNSASEQAVLNIICLLVSLGQPGCLDNDGDGVADVSEIPDAPGTPPQTGIVPVLTVDQFPSAGLPSVTLSWTPTTMVGNDVTYWIGYTMHPELDPQWQVAAYEEVPQGLLTYVVDLPATGTWYLRLIFKVDNVGGDLGNVVQVEVTP